ncbi:TetR/AcrR family transcriptional regulator [soil metagenome]
MDKRPLQETTSGSDGQARILRAAYPLFVEHGYKSVSMQQVANAAQVHKATLYHHFLNKDAIFRAVVLMALRQIRGQVAEVVERGGTAVEQLARIACQMFLNTQSDFGRLMTDAQENLPAGEWHALLRDESFPWDLYARIFDQAVTNGELPGIDVNMAISMFIGLMFGQTWVRKIGRVDDPLGQQVASTIVDILFEGLRHSDLALSQTESRPPSRVH